MVTVGGGGGYPEVAGSENEEALAKVQSDPSETIIVQCVYDTRCALFLRGAGGTLAFNLGEGVSRRVASVRLVRKT